MPPTPDKVEAAADRLRRLKAGESAKTIWPKSGDWMWSGDVDRRTLADAWLADHPADDAEAATAYWVTTLLPPEWPGHRHASFAGTLATVSWLTYNAAPPSPGSGGANFDLYVNGAAIDWRAASKGQLRRMLAALGVPVPVTAPVGTPEEIQAACDWKPKAKADFDLHMDDVRRRNRLNDPAYQQGYNDGLAAANPADDGQAIDAAWLSSLGGDDERGDGVLGWPVGVASRLCVAPSDAGRWYCWVREGRGDCEEAVTLPALTSRGRFLRLLAALGVPAEGGGS